MPTPAYSYHIILNGCARHKGMEVVTYTPFPFFIAAATVNEAIRKARMEATARGIITRDLHAARRVEAPAT